ncbi:MAG: DNA-protecting protein DprA [Chloroflexi bacterium]|nr:DNA-protecting protein DprA [Chloroflexota bacterium]
MIGVGDRGPVAGVQDAVARAEREALAVLVSVQGLGPRTLARLIAACGSAAAVLGVASGPGAVARVVAASVAADDEARPMTAALAEAIVAATERPALVLDRVRALELRLVTIADPDYPARLRAIEIPPALLFVRGDPAALNARHAVAVVGTRRPTDRGRRTAARIATALARAEALVVSGLAVGIDGAAHAAAVEAGGPTVAFIGGGHGKLFPTLHDRLAEAIVASSGAVVSEYAPDTEPTKGTFPRRNRLISGAADAVVVVEAGARSGALLTASWALEQGRECFLVPGAIDAPMSAGCIGFLRDWPGAARIVSGIPQLLDDLGLPAAAALPKPPPRLPRRPTGEIRPPSAGSSLKTLDPADEPVAIAIARGAATVDELIAVTHLTVAGALGALTRLETAGLVSARHGRYAPAGPLAAVPADAAPAERSGGRTDGRAISPAA